MTLPTDIFDAPITVIPPEQAAALAAELFGVTGAATRLAGERDQNFHLLASGEGGPGYVFKIHPPTEDPAVVEMQIGALEHLAARAPELAVPRVLLSKAGESAEAVDLGSGPQLARLLSYVPGSPMAGFIPLSAARLHSLGASMAALDRAMLGYEHPAASYVLLWDVQRALHARPMLAHIPDAEVRALAAEGLDRFEAYSLPRLSGLRTQIIHNDCNPNNVLYDAGGAERVVGFVDFGDMVRTPLVCELGVACAYHLLHDDDPLASIRPIVRAYHAALPLEPGEIDVLGDLILARAALSVAITCWRVSLNREDCAAIRAAYPNAARRLRRAASLSRDQAVRELCAACGE